MKSVVSKTVSRNAFSNAVPYNEHYKYESHKSKVLSLYKKSIKELDAWTCETGNPMEMFVWERVMLRARFDKHKNETDMVKASALLKAGEEEWWVNRHHTPFLLPWAEGGLAFQRQWKNSRAASMMNYWSPEDRARYPDIYAKYEKLQQLRQESWEEEMARLDEHEEELADEGETISDALPAAKKVDGLPPFWWKHATRGHERPECNDWDWVSRDLGPN